MEAVLPQPVTAPAFLKYRNRPEPPSATKIPMTEAICDTIFVVEDDPRVLDEITGFLTALRLKVIGCTSACDCLESIDQSVACVILNINLPDLCGLELQRRLATKSNPPVIFIADRCDIGSMVKAMKAGAIDFLTKPLDLPALAASAQAAFERGRRQWLRRAALAKLQARLSKLTPREREVLPLVVGGLLNKQAASLLGISEVTFQIHRSQVVRKMEAGSIAELVRMAVDLRIPHWRQLE